MEDLSSFASSYPQFCDPNTVRVPGSGTTPAAVPARPFHMHSPTPAAGCEAEAGAAKYAPYQATWYNAPRRPGLNPEDVGNLEEALANLEAFRQYINPTYADGVAKLVEGRLDEPNVNEWKAFFIGGRFAVEMANVFSRQPAGWKDFGKFLNRKTSVGATNYGRIP